MRFPNHKEILAQILYSLHSFMTATLNQVISVLTAIYIRRIGFIGETDNWQLDVRLHSAWIAGSRGKPILSWDN
ncbi:MAG: hypothetical protein QXI38_04965 [Conexivisphaerales archaeon]